MDSNSRAFASGWYMEVDVSDLRELAEKVSDMYGWHTFDTLRSVGIIAKDAAFIAAASPEAIIGLLDYIKELQYSIAVMEGADIAAISASQSKETEKPR